MELQKIKDLYEKHNYYYSSLINIFAIRTFPIQVNKFNDVLYCVLKDVVYGPFQVTTIPGLTTLKNPVNVNGTAILAPDQYRGVYSVDKHKNRYEALCQRLGPVRVWRDANKDGKHDLVGKLHSGFFGINIHKAGVNSINVDNWSAGCTVFKKSVEFDIFMGLVKSVLKETGNSYTYTLFHSM